MAVAYHLVNTPNPNAESAYAAAWERLNQTGARHPEGRRSHTAWMVGDVLHVLDVWETEAQFHAFAGTKLGPLLTEFGMELEGPPVAEPHLQTVIAGD